MVVSVSVTRPVLAAHAPGTELASRSRHTRPDDFLIFSRPPAGAGQWVALRKSQLTIFSGSRRSQAWRWS